MTLKVGEVISAEMKRNDINFV